MYLISYCCYCFILLTKNRKIDKQIIQLITTQPTGFYGRTKTKICEKHIFKDEITLGMRSLLLVFIKKKLNE